MKIEDYKLGQIVSLYGRIDAIDVENIHDKENTTTLKINTFTKNVNQPCRTISVNPKCEEVTIEPDKQKPVVPKFVADYIESCIRAGSGLIWSIRPDRDANELCRLTYDWLFPNGYRLEDGSFPDQFEPDNLVRPDSNNQLKFARAWLYGYTVEKEKLYTVEIPNPNIIGNERTVLMKNVFKQIVMVRVYGDTWRTVKGYQLTEAEIRKDFDWCWQFAKEVTE